MKFNRILIALGLTTFAFTACQSEFNEDAALDVQVTTNDNVKFDGQTITVKKGTPIQFNLGGDPDFISFYSGEQGSMYEYRNRTQIDPNEVESSKLTFTLDLQYGDPTNILSMHIADDFPGIQKGNYIADSTLVHDFAWKTLIAASEFPTTLTTGKKYEIPLESYMGKRIVIGFRYKGQSNVKAQTKYTFKNLKIVNQLKDGQTTSFLAQDFGFTPLNMMNRWNLADQATMTQNRAYGFVNNNTAGIWNAKDWNAFFIHSSSAGKNLKYSWLVSSHLVANACSPDKGISIKNITQGTNSYTHTYTKEGTYTATFIASNYNQKENSSVVQSYTVIVE